MLDQLWLTGMRYLDHLRLFVGDGASRLSGAESLTSVLCEFHSFDQVSLSGSHFLSCFLLSIEG